MVSTYTDCIIYYEEVLSIMWQRISDVRLYSQETWRVVTENRGVELVGQYISQVVSKGQGKVVYTALNIVHKE